MKIRKSSIKRSRPALVDRVELLEGRLAPSTSAFGSSLVSAVGPGLALTSTQSQTTANPFLSTAFTEGVGVALGPGSAVGGGSVISVSGTGANAIAAAYTATVAAATPFGSVVITAGLGAAISPPSH